VVNARLVCTGALIIVAWVLGRHWFDV
jgi:hypothetical protein